MPANWTVHRPGDPPVLTHDEPVHLEAGDLVVEVAGCLLDPRDAALASGACAGARFPLVPGRHSAGRVVSAGRESTAWIGRSVLIPEALPCGDCHPCRRALPLHCPDVVRPGVTHRGGLAQALVVPARFAVPLEGPLAWNRPLGEAACVGFFALPYQAVVSAGLGAGDVATCLEDEAVTSILRSKGVRPPGPDAPSTNQRFLLRAGAPFPHLSAGASIVAYGDEGSLALQTETLWNVEGAVRFVRACHPDLYAEIIALVIRGELTLEPPRMPMARADEALSRCASGPVLVLPD